ncbi:MAG: HEPN domain-containing protein [Anaerolineales bacterium]|nr:HEPN domain-containing protein [Anaerolineales bacterium]
MTTPAIQHFLKLADESREVANGLIDMGHPRFSVAQSYYTIFYLAQALLLTKGLTHSSHSAVVAAYGKEFAKTGLLDPKFHRYIIDAQKLRQIGHYGDESEEVTKEQAIESFQWAEEFKQAVETYLNNLT